MKNKKENNNRCECGCEEVIAVESGNMDIVVDFEDDNEKEDIQTKENE